MSDIANKIAAVFEEAKETGYARTVIVDSAILKENNENEQDSTDSSLSEENLSE